MGREEALAGLADDPAALEGGVLAVQCKGNFVSWAAVEAGGCRHTHACCTLRSCIACMLCH